MSTSESDLDLLPFGALVATDRFEVTFANRRALAELGPSAESCVGRSLFDVLPALGTPRLRAEIEKLTAAPTGPGSHVSLGVVPRFVPGSGGPDGIASSAAAEVRVVRHSSASSASDATPRAGVMVVWIDTPHAFALSRDVAVLRATHRELDCVRDALFDALRQKTDAMRRFAEQGNQSVRAITGVLEMLLAGACTPEQRASLGLVQAAIAQLERLFVGVIDPKAAAAMHSARRGSKAASAARSAAGAAPHRSLEILLVEDNPTNRRVATALLKRRGHHVTSAENGRDALNALERGRYDLVLMDVAMPVMDGIDATRTIRAGKEARARVPIVALTAQALEADRARCLAAGMNDFLAKPIDVVELERVLACYSNPTRDADEGSVAGVRERLEELGADADRGFLREALRDFAASTRSLLADVEARLESGNLAEIQVLAHRLVGTALSLGAHELAGTARKLEGAARDGQLDLAKSAHGKVSEELTRVLEFCERLARDAEAPAAPAPTSSD